MSRYNFSEDERDEYLEDEYDEYDEEDEFDDIDFLDEISERYNIFSKEDMYDFIYEHGLDDRFEDYEIEEYFYYNL